MSAMRDHLDDLLDVVTVELPCTFTWFGHPGPAPADTLRATMSSEQLREWLHGLLQVHLYQNFYCSGGPVEARPTPMGRGAASLIEDLCAANAGRGPWQGGWEAQQQRDGEVIAQRRGLAVRVQDGGWRRLPAPEVSATAMELRLPKEARSRLPGFYVALSDADFDSAEGRKLVRLYWNVRADGAARLVRHVTTLFNLAGLPFGFKCVNEPGAFDRCDAGVLYLDREDWAAAAPILTQVYAGSLAGLASQTPPFTKRLAPGLALAEDPSQGESFGMSRCSLLAEGLIRAAEHGGEDAGARRTTIAETFAERGIDLQRAHLEPGSVDRYALDEPVSGLGDRDGTGARLPRVIASSAPKPRAGDDERDRERFLHVAGVIATQLCSRALWYDARCTWVGADPTPPEGGPATSSTLGPTLYSGTAGVALFLAHAARLTATSRADHTAVGAARHAIRHADRLPPTASLGAYTGRLGVALGVAHVGVLLDEVSLTRDARLLAYSCLSDRGEVRERDLLSGDAGAIVALLELTDLTNDDRFADAATAIGHEFLEAAESDGDALWWRSSIPGADAALTGFSHGAAGAVWALLELYEQTHDERWREAAVAASRFERRWFDPDAGNWRDLRELPGSGPFMTAWCHGAPGIALSRLCAAAPLPDTEWRSEALIGVDTTRRAVSRALDQGVDDFSLCHGLSGNADVLLEVSRRNGDDRARRLAVDVGRFGVQAYGEPSRVWPCGTRTGETPGLLLGTAGIGSFYLRLATPDVPTLLLPRHWASRAADRIDWRPTHEPPDRETITVSGGDAAPPLVRHDGNLDEEQVRAFARLKLEEGGLAVTAEELFSADAERWEIGLELRDRLLPSRIPAFADVLDLLALADADPHLWNSLPFMLAFGYEQAAVLRPLTDVSEEHAEDAANACALFSALLSVFDYVVDETEQRDAAFEIEDAGVRGLFVDPGTDAELATAYQRSSDPRVRLVCILFSALGTEARRLAAGADARRVASLVSTTRGLFDAERTSTLGRARSLTELRQLATASNDKSVLPFLTLLHLADLPAPGAAPSPRATASSRALGRAVCLADDLADLLTDLDRGAPSPLVVALTETVLAGTVEGAPASADDAVVLEVVEQAVADLLAALQPDAFSVGDEPPLPVVSYARRTVARWLGCVGVPTNQAPDLGEAAC